MAEDPHAETLAAPDPAGVGPAGAAGRRYVLLALLGAGGMGNVYKARDAELDEVVALKVLRPELIGAPGALERFRLEVKLARRVTHANVARVFDIGEQDGEKILTMELVDGEPLSRLLAREGAPSLARTISIASAIAAGVGAAHAAGVVHRDLKPDNVLLGRDGRVVVTDFGIARAAASGANVTGAGIVGTPAYMAPEQLEPGAQIDERADVYAFGALLYELATGARAWNGDSIFAIAAARLTAAPPDPRAVRDVPTPLAEIILRAMARAPADRYPSMAAIVADLSRLSLHDRVPSTVPGVVPDALPDGAARVIPAPAETRGAANRRAPSPMRAVAVLPFKNLGPTDQQYVADGLTEDLIDLLSVAKGLRVRSRGVMMAMNVADRDPRDLGRELGVDVVVEGSVRRGRGALRIQARVISVADGFQLWARRFDGSEAEVLTKSDEVARAVAEALTVELDAPAREAPTDPAAIDLYLRARERYHQSFSMLDHGAATRLYEGALALAPNDPLMLASFAAARSREPVVDAEGLAAADRAAERALALAPALPEAHLAAGLLALRANDVRRAIPALRRALDLAPNHAEALETLGRILTQCGDAGGVPHVEAAVALEPRMDFPRISLAVWHAMSGDWDRAFAATRVPTDRGTVVIMPVLARLILWRDDRKLAEDTLITLTDAQRKNVFLSGMLEVVARRAPLDVPPQHAPGLAPWMVSFFAQIDAEIACALGDRARALRAIARADDDGSWDVLWFRCPLFDALRGDPEFVRREASVRSRAQRILAP